MDFSTFKWKSKNAINEAKFIVNLYGEPSCYDENDGGAIYWNVMCPEGRTSGYKKCVIYDKNSDYLNISIEVSISESEKKK